jgi:hypothetical protein
LFPIMWAAGEGSDVMKRIAAPMVGGIFTSFLLELLVYPAIYELWRWRGLPETVQEDASVESVSLKPSAALAGPGWMYKSAIRTERLPEN